MNFEALDTRNKLQCEHVIALFQQTFRDAEGAQEGQTIANLVTEMLTTAKGLQGFLALKEEKLVGAVCFTPLGIQPSTEESATDQNSHPDNAPNPDQEPNPNKEPSRNIQLLSPMAVATPAQKQGIGQQLLRHSIDTLKNNGVTWLITYGDPQFYQKVGFAPLSETTLKAPHTLSQPEGWLGQSLSGDPITPIPGTLICTPALDKPAYW